MSSMRLSGSVGRVWPDGFSPHAKSTNSRPSRRTGSSPGSIGLDRQGSLHQRAGTRPVVSTGPLCGGGHPDGPAALLAIEDDPEAVSRWHAHAVNPAFDYAATVLWEGPPMPVWIGEFSGS